MKIVRTDSMPRMYCTLTIWPTAKSSSAAATSCPYLTRRLSTPTMTSPAIRGDMRCFANKQSKAVRLHEPCAAAVCAQLCSQPLLISYASTATRVASLPCARSNKREQPFLRIPAHNASTESHRACNDASETAPRAQQSSGGCRALGVKRLYDSAIARRNTQAARHRVRRKRDAKHRRGHLHTQLSLLWFTWAKLSHQRGCA